MTAGNGNDTLFLANISKHVYAFDISQEAIIRSRKRLAEKYNVTLICDSHVNIDKYIKDKIRLFIFNLGYLPNSDELRITKANDTLVAFKKAYDLLEEGGYIIITFYIGHRGGKDEYYLLDDYIKKNRFQLVETYRQDRIESPITYIIRKS